MHWTLVFTHSSFAEASSNPLMERSRQLEDWPKSGRRGMMSGGKGGGAVRLEDGARAGLMVLSTASSNAICAWG